MNSTRRARCKQGEILARGKRDDGQGEVVVPLLQRGGAFPPEMFGYSKHEALGHPLDESITPVDLISEAKEDSKVVKDGNVRGACNAPAREFINARRLSPKRHEICLETVSATCGSGWVRKSKRLIAIRSLRMHPPATAGGTDF